MSSRWIKSSSSISPSWSTMTVRRGVAYCSLTASISVLTIAWMPGARTQDIEIVGDLGGELVEFVLDFVATQRGQALQAQVENRLGLLGRQPIGAVVVDLVARIVDQQNQRFDIAGPASRGPSGLARLVGVA